MSVILKDKITGKVYPAISHYSWMLLNSIMDSKCNDRSWRHCPKHRAEFIALLEEELEEDRKTAYK